MNISKKLLPVSLAALFIAGVLTGCPSKEVTADQALKEAYTQLSSSSYNFDGYMTANVKKDEAALIGTKGGLTQEQADSELELLGQLESADGQQVLAMLQNGKLTFNGAVDGDNLKYEFLLGVNYELSGMKATLDIPIQINLKDELVIYVDPKAAKAFNALPPQIGTKLIKASINDIPGISADDKAKFKAIGPMIKKYEKIANASFQKMDASFFKDVDVSDDAKKAGAVRTVQLELTPEQNNKISTAMFNEILTVVKSDFKLSDEQIADIKQALEESNKETLLFMGNVVTVYGLNDKGQIVYMTYNQSFKGAKHVGDMSFVGSIKDYGKPTFTIDPAKQGTISILELMMMMG